MLLAAHLKAASGGRSDVAVQKAWRLADAGLELERLPQRNVLELRSRRIFMDERSVPRPLQAGDERRRAS